LSVLRDQLFALGIVPGDVVLIHSSMKALKTDQTPEVFLKELMSVLTCESTLLMPALTYDTVTPDQPFFSATDSEPCVGILPRTFAKMDGVERSLHPTHSVCAWGAKAELLTRDHILDDTPVGPHSPFMLLAKSGGKILFIGDILHACTLMHGIEEIVNAPYVMNTEKTLFTLKDTAGKVHIKEYYTHDFKGWEQEYTRIADILDYPDIQAGTLYAAPCFLLDAGTLISAATVCFKKDIYAFVSPVQ